MSSTYDEDEVSVIESGPQAVSEIPAKLLKALLPVQAELAGVSIEKSGKNPHLKNQYATLSDVLEAVMTATTKHGVVVMQYPGTFEARRATIVTVIGHAESGEQFSFLTTVNLREDTAQGYGGGLTYAARYALMRGFCLRTADDDGNAASGVRGARNGGAVVHQETSGEEESGGTVLAAPASDRYRIKR